MTRRRILVASIAYAVMALVALGLGAWAGRPLPVEHPRPWWSGAVSGHLVSLALGLGVALLTIASTRWLIERTVWARALRSEFRSVLEGATSAQLVWLGIASGTAEELLFRGAIQPLAGWVLTSIVFGAIHVGPSRAFLPWTLWAVAMGLVLGAIFEGTGSLAGCVLAHVLINAVNLRVIVLHDARIDRDDGRPPPPRLVSRRR